MYYFILYNKKITKTRDKNNITIQPRMNKLPNTQKVQKTARTSLLIIIILLWLVALQKTTKHTWESQNYITQIRHIQPENKKFILNNTFVRKMHRATNSGFWNTLKKVTGTPLNVPQARQMSAYTVYHKTEQEKSTTEINVPKEISSQAVASTEIKKPLVPPVKHPMVLANDESKLDPNYIPNMRLTHTPPSEAIQKKYGFKVIVSELLGYDKKGKLQYLIGTDKPIQLKEMTAPGKNHELTEHFFGLAIVLDPTSTNYEEKQKNRNTAKYVQRRVIAELKYLEWAELKKINQKQLEKTEKYLEKKYKKNQEMNQNTNFSENNKNKSINNEITNENI